MARRPMGLEEGGHLVLPVLPPNSLRTGIVVPASYSSQLLMACAILFM